MGKSNVVARKKIVPLTSLDEVVASVRLVGEKKRAKELAKAEMNAKIEEVKKTFIDRVAVLDQAESYVMQQLQMYAENNRTQLLGDSERKTIKLPTGDIGWRKAALRIEFVAEDREIVATCKELGLQRFYEIVEVPRKQLMKKEPAVAKLIPGVAVHGGEDDEFFVKPADITVAANVPAHRNGRKLIVSARTSQQGRRKKRAKSA